MQKKLSILTDEEYFFINVRYEMLSVQFNILGISFIVHAFAVVVLFYIIHKAIDFNVFSKWLFFLFFIDFSGLMALLVYRKNKFVKENIKLWWRLETFIVTMIASVWGSTGYIYMSKLDVKNQFFLMLFLLAFSAGISQGTIANSTTNKLSIIALLSPLTLWCLQQNSSFYIAMPIIVIYMAFLLTAAAKFNHLLKESLILRFKNIALNERLEKSNETLEQEVIERTQELNLAKQEAEAANKAKTEFLSIISHELRTPLRAINSGVTGLNRIFPKLLEGYLLAKDADLAVPYMTPQQYQRVPEIAKGVVQETESAFDFIKMILTSISNSELAQEQIASKCSIFHCIALALERYPFAEGERALIDWEHQPDFIFSGNELLMVHILFNLLKNALYYIEEAGKGRIMIWVELGESYNTLHFRDTAQGIAAENLPKIFDRHYSKSKGGTGIGLDFCRIVITSFGGTISCKAEEHSYTEFVITLPNIRCTAVE